MRRDCALATLPLIGMSLNFERKASVRALQGEHLHAILKQIYTASVLSQLEEHWCSMITPCIKARPLLADFMSLRLVSHAWNGIWKSLFSTSLYFRDRRPYTDPPKPPYTGQTIQLDDGITFKFCETPDPRRNRAWYQCIAGRYRIQHAAQSEYNVSVYFARDHGGPLGCEDCTEVAIKVFYCKDDADEYTREKEIYEKLSKEPMKGVPEISWMGKSGDKYVFAMTRLGSTLQEFHDRAPDKKLNDRLLLHIAIQLMDRYKYLHSRQVIHNGVKPGNIAICPPDTTIGTPDRAMIYIFDFGFSQFLRDEPQEERVAANGMYASVMTLWRARQSQRDDLESLCYLFSYLFHGTLPWNDDRHCSIDIRHIKMKMKKSDLFAGMDPAFGEFWDAVKLLAWGEVPDYDGMKERFCRSWKEKGYDGEPGTVDWQVMWDELVEDDKVRKAEEEARRVREEGAKGAAKRAKKYKKKKAAKKKAAAKRKLAADEQTATTEVDSKANVEDAMKVNGEVTDGNISSSASQEDGKEDDSDMVSVTDKDIEERSDDERDDELETTRVDTKDSEKAAQDGKALTVDTDETPAGARTTDHAMNVDTVAASTKAVAVSDEDATQNTSKDRKVDIEKATNGATVDNMAVDVETSVLADKATDSITKGSDALGLGRFPSNNIIEASSESSGAMPVTNPGDTEASNGETGGSTTLSTDLGITTEARALAKNDLDLGSEDGKSGDVVVLVVNAMVVDENGPITSYAWVDIKKNSSSDGSLGCGQGRQSAMQCSTEAEGDSTNAPMENANADVVVCG